MPAIMLNPLAGPFQGNKAGIKVAKSNTDR
jgi:hypothetical protein